MREMVEVTRRLLNMERVTYHGEFVDVDDIEIDIVHGDRSPKDVPIYIAATTGMKVMELADEIGDGILLNYLVGPGYNKEALEHLAVGAERAGRTLDDVDRPQLVVCSLDDDRGHARPLASSSPSTSASSRGDRQGERRRRRAARSRRHLHLAGDAGADQCVASSPTTSSSSSPVGHARRGAG